MAALDTTIDALNVFGDRTRVRLVTLLAGRELTVAELTASLGLPQPRVSTHLGRLREAGLVRDRREGGSTYYSADAEAMPEAARGLWALLAAETRDAVLAGDRARCEAVVRARAEARGFPDGVAGSMERHYSPGRTWEALARGLLGLVRAGDVLDVGAGDGAVAELLAPRSSSVTCLDKSEALCAAAGRRLREAGNVRVVCADAHAMPFEPGSFDAVVCFHTLELVDEPADVIAEAARVLRPGGAIALATLEAHAHAPATAAYRHLHAGFSAAALRRWLTGAGLEVASCGVTSRERRPPQFSVVTAFAQKPAAAAKAPRGRRPNRG